MEIKILSDAAERTYAVIMQTGEEAISQLERFARDYNLSASHFTAIGAFSKAVLGYFEWTGKIYERIPIDEQVEALSLIGDIALQDGKQKVHVHAVLGKRDGSTCGGHLLEAHVRPTLEVILVESPNYLKRTMDAESGLPLIHVGK